MTIEPGDHVAQCRQCGGVVGIAGDRTLQDYLAIWESMNVMVHRHDGDQTEMRSGHNDTCPNRFAVQSTRDDERKPMHGEWIKASGGVA